MEPDTATSPRPPNELPPVEFQGPADVGRSDHPTPPERTAFTGDFRRFFIGGLKALLPTLITLWLLFWVWNFLWQNIGQHVIWVIKWLWVTLGEYGLLPEKWYLPAGRVNQILNVGNSTREPDFGVKLLGVGLAILLVYILGVFVGNLIGRTIWRVLERAVMRLPLVRAIYPSVKQVTDFLLADRKSGSGGGGGGHFAGSRVVAVQARHQDVWSIGLVTGQGYGPLNDAIRDDMVTVFIPSSPTAVAGYVVVAHRKNVVDLPLTVEEALRLLISGGVLVPATASVRLDGPVAGPAAVSALSPASSNGSPPAVVVVPAAGERPAGVG